MKIKYIPIKWNEYARINRRPNTTIEYIDENTISIDGEAFTFDEASVTWENLHEVTNGRIFDAKRVNGELYVDVIRYYTDNAYTWDTGDYHDISRENTRTSR